MMNLFLRTRPHACTRLSRSPRVLKALDLPTASRTSHPAAASGSGGPLFPCTFTRTSLFSSPSAAGALFAMTNRGPHIHILGSSFRPFSKSAGVRPDPPPVADDADSMHHASMVQKMKTFRIVHQLQRIV